VAEADRDLTDVLKSALADRAGYDVQIARTAFEAGALAESFKPHVVLMNVNVPGLTGRESVRSIRNLPAFSHVKLVAMTDGLTDGDAEALRQDGFDSALAKPFEIARAVETIEALLERE
jgi:DNA-binding response OmpR family regulator